MSMAKKMNLSRAVKEYLCGLREKYLIYRMGYKMRNCDSDSGHMCWVNLVTLENSPASFDYHDMWSHKGEKSITSGDFLEANRCYEKALKEQPRDPVALNNRGYCLERLGHREMAYNCFRKALKTSPNDPGILTNTGICLCYLGHYREALRHFDRALQTGSSPVQLWNNRGYCLAGLHRYQEATIAYKKALAQNAVDSPDLLGNLASTLVKLGDYQNALLYFDRALRLNPDDHLLLNNVGVCLDKEGRFDLALKCYGKALLNQSDNSVYLYNKGVCLTHMNRRSEAMQCFNQVVEHDPGHAVAWGGLASLYLGEGDTETALLCYNNALGLNS